MESNITYSKSTKLKGIAFIVFAILSIAVIGILILYFISLFHINLSMEDVRIYLYVFTGFIGAYSCQILIGLHLAGKLRINIIIMKILGLMCLLVSAVQILILSAFIVTAFMYRFSDHRPLPMVSFLPVICIPFIIMTAKAGLIVFRSEKKRKLYLSPLTAYLYFTYTSIVFILASFPYDPDISNRIISFLGLRERYISLGDIGYKGGEINYKVYGVYMLIGTLIFLLINMVYSRRFKNLNSKSDLSK